MKKHILCILAVCIVISPIKADDALWMLVSGNWTVDTSEKVFSDSTSRTRMFGYNEIHDMNSVSSISGLDKVTKIISDLEITAPSNDNKAMLFFGAQTQKNFYAVRVNGSREAISSFSLIRGEIKDTTLPVSAKNNFTVSELVSSPFSAKWGEKISIQIESKKKKLVVSINGVKAEYAIGGTLPSGMIGFSHANNFMRVRSIRVFSGDTVVFEDDFSKDRIKRLSVKAEKIKK